MEKGQHIRFLITDGQTDKVIAMATELTAHFSAQTENSTTKDTTDADDGAAWDVFEVTGRSGDIQFSGLIGVGADTGGLSFADIISKFGNTAIAWKLALVGGTNNRTVSKTICSGSGKITNLQATGQNRQNASYTGTMNVYGPVAPGND